LAWLITKSEILEGLKKDETIYKPIMNFKLILMLRFSVAKQTVVAWWVTLGLRCLLLWSAL
jgi:hypothetical protein